MLSDERISEIAEDIYCSEGTRAEIEHSIRVALTEDAQSPAVPVMGEAVAWYWNENGDVSAFLGNPSDTALANARKLNISPIYLYRAPTTCITQAELDAKDARIRELEECTSVSLTVGGGHVVYGSVDAMARAQMYVLLDSRHPVEAKDTARYFATALQKAEAELEALREEVIKLRKLIYIGEHEFDDCTYKFRLEELAPQVRAKDARISELEFVIEEIIRINHHDFRGHEIAHAAIAKERQS